MLEQFFTYNLRRFMPFYSQNKLDVYYVR